MVEEPVQSDNIAQVRTRNDYNRAATRQSVARNKNYSEQELKQK